MARRLVVIGGGPAGCACAIAARRGGVASVELIESRAFPRTKVCGEYLSPWASGRVEELLGHTAVRALGARSVDRVAVHLGARCVEWATPSRGMALSRASLDAALVREARGCGVVVRQPARVRRVDCGADGVGVVLADGSKLEADSVVHADGSGRHDAGGPVPMLPGWVAFKCHVAGLEPGIVGMRSFLDAYVGTVGVEGDRGTCALVVSKAALEAVDEDVDSLVRSCWGSGPAFDRVGDWHACGVARSGVIRGGSARSVRVGNAACAVDPVGGEGIALALWSGGLAGSVLARSGACVARAQVERGFARKLAMRRPLCRASAAVLTNPGGLAVMWPLLRIPALSLLPWYGLSGKPLTRGSGFDTLPA